MIKKLLAVFVVAAAVFAFGCEAGQKPATDAKKDGGADKAKAMEITEAEAKEALESLRSAVEKNDAEAMDKIYGDDYMLVNPDGAAQTKAERMKAMKDGNIKYEKVEFSDTKIRTYGNAAVVVTNAKGKANVDGKDQEMDMTATIVFVKTKDGVREVSAHLTDKAKAE